MKKILTTPIREEDILDLRIGDVVYLTGTLATCRDTGHKYRVLKGNIPKLDLTGGAVFHTGPITRKRPDGGWDMVAVGPTTSMRMERYEKEFLEMTGTKLLIGKGGMGEKTTAACKDMKVIHTVFPGGCAVIAASEVEEITDLEWEELGMPEAFWVCKVKEFGPLIVSIDTEGNNLFENNKKIYRERKDMAIKEIH